MKVEEIMTPAPVTAEIRGTVAEVIEKLLEYDLSCIPVVSGNEYVGMVTEKELRPFAFPLRSQPDEVRDYRKSLLTKISEIVRTDLPVVHPEMELVAVLDLLVDSGAGILAVVDSETEALCGIVTLRDIVKSVRTLFDD